MLSSRASRGPRAAPFVRLRTHFRCLQMHLRAPSCPRGPCKFSGVSRTARQIHLPISSFSMVHQRNEIGETPATSKCGSDAVRLG